MFTFVAARFHNVIILKNNGNAIDEPQDDTSALSRRSV